MATLQERWHTIVNGPNVRDVPAKYKDAVSWAESKECVDDKVAEIMYLVRRGRRGYYPEELVTIKDRYVLWNKIKNPRTQWKLVDRLTAPPPQFFSAAMSESMSLMGGKKRKLTHSKDPEWGLIEYRSKSSAPTPRGTPIIPDRVRLGKLLKKAMKLRPYKKPTKSAKKYRGMGKFSVAIREAKAANSQKRAQNYANMMGSMGYEVEDANVMIPEFEFRAYERLLLEENRKRNLSALATDLYPLTGEEHMRQMQLYDDPVQQKIFREQMLDQVTAIAAAKGVTIQDLLMKPEYGFVDTREYFDYIRSIDPIQWERPHLTEEQANAKRAKKFHDFGYDNIYDPTNHESLPMLPEPLDDDDI